MRDILNRPVTGTSEKTLGNSDDKTEDPRAQLELFPAPHAREVTREVGTWDGFFVPLGKNAAMRGFGTFFQMVGDGMVNHHPGFQYKFPTNTVSPRIPELVTDRSRRTSS